MTGISAMLRKEMRIYVATPIFYLTGFFFLVLGGFFFYSNVARYNLVSLQAAQLIAQNPLAASQLNAQTFVFQPLFEVMAIIFLFMVPLVTMRLLAEEKRSGTAELLFTDPLTDWAVILGKYLAALFVYLIFLACTVSYALVFSGVAKLDWGALASGYVGLILVGGAFLALGLLTSSLTQNQIVAGVAAFALLLLFWLIGWQQETTGFAGVLTALSLAEHYSNFPRGVVDTRDLIYYLSFIFFFLFLTKRQLESRRWRA